jgi:FtsP/CotA-like multicopper oxidase with cupredoxin domain
VPCGPGIAPGDDVVTTYFTSEGKPSPPAACRSAYEIAVPDDQPAGLYWYHTHFHGESEAQTLLGLSGAIVVENADDDVRRQRGIADRILVVRDPPAPKPEHPAAPKSPTVDPPGNVHRSQPAIATPPVAATASGITARLPQCAFGKCINTAAEVQCSTPAEREQETVLSINGTSIRDALNPAGSVPEIRLAVRREERWRLVNAAADTYVRVHLADIDGSGIVRSVPIEVVGLDGAPFADERGRPKAQMITDPIMVPPGGRIEFNVKLDAPAAQHRVVLRTAAVETGCAGDLMPARDLVAVRIDTPPSDAPSEQRAISQRTTLQRAMPSADTPVRRRTFAFTEYQRAKNSKTDFYITEVSRPDAIIEPYPMDGAPASVVEVDSNSVEEWTILNFTHEIHNFHIHQLHFRVLESDDKFVEGRMLDTINVPVALPEANWSPDDPVTPGKVRLLMRFHQNISGEFVFHCHILSHEDKGMMGLIRVVDPGGQPSSSSERRPEHRH